MVQKCTKTYSCSSRKFKGAFIESCLVTNIIRMSNETAPVEMDVEKIVQEPEGKSKLRKWLNMNFRIEMTDGRVLIGVFLCTDRDANVILGACSEYLKNSDGEMEDPRVLGLVMVPGRHIVSIQIDDTSTSQKYFYDE